MTGAEVIDAALTLRSEDRLTTEALGEWCRWDQTALHDALVQIDRAAHGPGMGAVRAVIATTLGKAEKEAQRAKVAATHPLIQGAVLTVRFEPDGWAVFAPYRYEVEVGSHVLAGRAPTMIQAAERAQSQLDEHMATEL
jgi:hypothetical protein